MFYCLQSNLTSKNRISPDCCGPRLRLGWPGGRGYDPSLRGWIKGPLRAGNPDGPTEPDAAEGPAATTAGVEGGFGHCTQLAQPSVSSSVKWGTRFRSALFGIHELVRVNGYEAARPWGGRGDTGAASPQMSPRLHGSASGSLSVGRREAGVAAVGHQTQEDFSPSSLSEDWCSAAGPRPRGPALSRPSLCTCWRHWARCPPCRDCEPHSPVAGGPFRRQPPTGSV